MGPFDAKTYVDLKVNALEEIDIEGTRVKAFQIQMEGFAVVSSYALTIKGTIWVEPLTMRMVRYDREVRAGGRLIDATRIKVTGYKPVRRS